MIELWVLLVAVVAALYLGVSAGMWFIMTIRDGEPLRNLSVLWWPVLLLCVVGDWCSKYG